MTLPIYLDYAATTPIDPKVVEKMLPYLSGTGYGNPASLHSFGQAAKKAVEDAREKAAALLHAEPAEIIWTSGATEANNLALKGAAQLYQGKGKHIVTIKTEHKSVLDTCQQLEKTGFSVTYLAPTVTGVVDLAQLEAALKPDTILVSVMLVNNELGVIQDISSIAQLTAARDILLHVDAAQAAGKLPIDLTKTPIDLLSCCAHKVYGPKGIGALYVRKRPRVRVAAQIHGGGHEQGMRSGTLATHQIVGMGEAFSLAGLQMHADFQHASNLRDYLWQQMQALPGIYQQSSGAPCLPYIINLRFDKLPASELIKELPGIAFSTGSACDNKGIEPSYVLRALGLSAEEAHQGVRLSFGRFTTLAEIKIAVQQFKQLFY